MRQKIVGFVESIRGAASILGVLLLGLGLLVGKHVGTRGEIRDQQRLIDRTREEIAYLGERLERERLERDEQVLASRGQGPGGIRSPHERHLFRGPTEARAALDLALAADATKFRKFEYEGGRVRALGTFPPSSDGMEDEMMESTTSPVRDRIHFVEWPIEVRLETDYWAALKLIDRLTFSEPSFSVKEMQLEVVRDGDGALVDRLEFTGLLSTFWLDAEGSS